MTISISDTGWLSCSECEPLWCSHRASAVIAVEDASLFCPSMNFSLPILPTGQIFVDLHLGEEEVGGSALMWMEFTPDIGRTFQVQLGYWNPGEGIISMRSVVFDYLASKLSPDETFRKGPILTKCPNRAHNIASAVEMSKLGEDVNSKVACLWDIVMEKACTPCLAAFVYDPAVTKLD